MSSMYNSSSSPVDAQSSQELVDDLGLNLQTSHESNLLSPYNNSQTLSSSASPTYNIGGTPNDSISEYSNYQSSELSEIEDPFFGVDFAAGVQRFDSFPSAILAAHAQSAEANRALANTQTNRQSITESEPRSASTYPLSPIHSSIHNTPSPAATSNGAKAKTTISQHELTTELHKSQYHTVLSQPPNNPTAVQLTPDHSGSSHTSAEGFEPVMMGRPEQSPRISISQWESMHPQSSYFEPPARERSSSNANQFGGPLPININRNEEGQWRSSETTGQAGLDPQARRQLSDVEVPSLKQDEERRRLEHTNSEVLEWRSQAGGSSDAEDEQPTQSYFNNNMWEETSGHRRPHPEDDNNIAPVDDAESIHENRLIEGQTYYNFKNATPNNFDYELMKQSRHWNDAPAVPHITRTSFQPQTSNDAIRKFNANADTFSLSSRAATWGTRRRSEPSIADWESVADGSFLKRLSITKSKEGNRPRQNSIFDQGLDRLANIVRKRSDSKLKRARSAVNIPEETHTPMDPRKNSQDTLAPPPRTSSFGPKPTPSLNTTLAAMAGTMAAVGTTHARSGSVSGPATSPKSPLHIRQSLGNVIKRARSKSDITGQEKSNQTGIANLWRGQGGPPVPTLSSTQVEAETKQPEAQDNDEDDEDEDEVGDESDLKMEPEEEADPITPNYEGFKAHVRRLNPEMSPQYNWLVSRIAYQQEIRYKNLLELRVKHSGAVSVRNCQAGRLCMSLGGIATLLDGKGNPRDFDRNTSGLQLVTDFSDDSNPGEGALTEETFPQGVPRPPTRNLPAEFECQLCFKAKKFQKPSDWTKHVHEDVQPFTCTYDKCKEPKSFKRKADWVRHENERHRHLEWWVCQMDDCRHPCYRKDNFLQHLVREHKLPEPKQKTKAAIKKAKSVEPAWIMLEQCHHETQNRPQDEPCKFCGKSFATWKKLTVHLAKHMEHISLPILRLVEARDVDANTIISPVEQNLTPITPVGRSGGSPFSMHNPSRGQMGQNFTPSSFVPHQQFYSNPVSSAPYMQPQIPQEITYLQTEMYNNTNQFGVQPVEQPRGYGPVESNNIGQMDQSRGFGSLDQGFPNVKVEQPREFGSMDSAYSHGISEHGYNQHQGGFSLPPNFTGVPAVSGFQSPNVPVMGDPGFSYNGMPGNGQDFQQVPMSRAPGSASSYGQSHSPQNVSPFYHQ